MSESEHLESECQNQNVAVSWNVDSECTVEEGPTSWETLTVSALWKNVLRHGKRWQWVHCGRRSCVMGNVDSECTVEERPTSWETLTVSALWKKVLRHGKRWQWVHCGRTSYVMGNVDTCNRNVTAAGECGCIVKRWLWLQCGRTSSAVTARRVTCVTLTPSLPQPVKCPGWMVHGRACTEYIFRSYNICSQCYAF